MEGLKSCEDYSLEVTTKLFEKYPILMFFTYSHLRESALKDMSKHYADLAFHAASGENKHPQETAAGLRKLLEAKDCAVRSLL